MRSKLVVLLVFSPIQRVVINEWIHEEMRRKFEDFFVSLSFWCSLTSCSNSMESFIFLLPIYGTELTFWKNCRRGNKHFDVFLTDLVHPFSVGRRRVRKKFLDKCLFGANVRISAFDVVFYKSTSPFLYPDLACEQFCLPSRKRFKLEKWKPGDTIFFFADDTNQQHLFFLKHHFYCCHVVFSLTKKYICLHRWPIFSRRNVSSEK